MPFAREQAAACPYCNGSGLGETRYFVDGYQVERETYFAAFDERVRGPLPSPE